MLAKTIFNFLSETESGAHRVYDAFESTIDLVGIATNCQRKVFCLTLFKLSNEKKILCLGKSYAKAFLDGGNSFTRRMNINLTRKLLRKFSSCQQVDLKSVN